MGDKESERVEPAPLQVALLYKILKAERETLDFMKETTLEGVEIPLPETTVTDAKAKTIDISHQPLRSVYFRNKGPNTVYYLVNDDPTAIPIEDQETVTTRKPRRTIVKVTLRVNAGESATVKMVGQY